MTPYASYVAMSIMNSLSLAISGFLFGYGGVILVARWSSKAVQVLGWLLVVSGFIAVLLGIFLALSPHVPESSTFSTVRQSISSYNE